jgi:hypothetical protein
MDSGKTFGMTKTQQKNPEDQTAHSFLHELFMSFFLHSSSFTRMMPRNDLLSYFH